LIQSIDVQEYNKVINHPLQSWEWGEVRLALGTEIVRVGVYKGEKLIDAYQMSIHPIPATPYKIGYIPRSAIPPAEVIAYFTEYARQNKIIFIKFEPYVFEEAIVSKQMVVSVHPLFTPWTQILDLRLSDEELKKRLKSKTRYNIGLAQRKGVTVKYENNDRGFDTFIKLYFETCHRQHYFGHNETYHKAVWNNLKQKVAHILIAYYEDTPLAAYELFLFKNHWYYVYGGTSDLQRNLMASNLLMWEAVKLGKKLGAHTFDMWGSLPPQYDGHDPWAGFTRFKEGYGTVYKKTVGSYDLVINKTLYAGYNIAQKLRTKLLEIFG